MQKMVFSTVLAFSAMIGTVGVLSPTPQAHPATTSSDTTQTTPKNGEVTSENLENFLKQQIIQGNVDLTPERVQTLRNQLKKSGYSESNIEKFLKHMSHSIFLSSSLGGKNTDQEVLIELDPKGSGSNAKIIAFTVLNKALKEGHDTLMIRGYGPQKPIMEGKENLQTAFSILKNKYLELEKNMN